MGEWEQTRQAYLPLRASYKKTHQPILPTTNHPIFSSCVVPLYPSYLLQTHSSLSLSPRFCNLALQKHLINFLKKINTKTTVKVSVRCIWGPIKDPRKPVKKRPIQLQLARFMAVRIKFDGICRGILAFCPYF